MAHHEDLHLVAAGAQVRGEELILRQLVQGVHQHLALALIIVRQAGGHPLGGHVLHQLQPQGHHGLHSAVKIVHNGAEQRGAGQAAHGGHLRQMLVL